LCSESQGRGCDFDHKPVCGRPILRPPSNVRLRSEILTDFVAILRIIFRDEESRSAMGIAYLAITILLAAIVTFSGIGKIHHDPHIVQVIHEVVGVPLRYFPLLAACEFAGALGVVLGIWWPVLGVGAAIALVIYFVGASVSHLRVGDVKGIGPAAFILMVAAAALALRLLTYKLHSAG